MIRSYRRRRAHRLRPICLLGQYRITTHIVLGETAVLRVWRTTAVVLSRLSRSPNPIGPTLPFRRSGALEMGLICASKMLAGVGHHELRATARGCASVGRSVRPVRWAGCGGHGRRRSLGRHRGARGVGAGRRSGGCLAVGQVRGCRSGLRRRRTRLSRRSALRASAGTRSRRRAL